MRWGVAGNIVAAWIVTLPAYFVGGWALMFTAEAIVRALS